MKLEGGCLCDSVRYQFSGTPIRSFFCHCRDCQRSGGSLLHFGITVTRAGFQVEGKPSTFETTGDSGRTINRFFCSKCGSGLWNELEVIPDSIIIKAGTLDHIPETLKPTSEVFAKRKSAWLHTDDDLESHSALRESRTEQHQNKTKKRHK